MNNLAEAWASDKSILESKTLQQLLAIFGDGKLNDGNTTSVEFRDFLKRIPSERLKHYANYCLSDGFNGSGLALQDIFNQVGTRLGFSVEYGLYKGTRTSI